MVKRSLFIPFSFLAVLAWLFVQWGNPTSAQSFLTLTDIHFNPYHNLTAEQFQTLRQKPVEQWGDFFRNLRQPASEPGKDSNYTLMVSALDAAKATHPDPEFILYLGDFMAHDWQSSYDKLATKSIADDPQSYRDFTTQTLKLMAREFASRFPDVPVIATLGNDDAFCGDYWIQSSSPFNEVFSKVWLPLLKDSVHEPDFMNSFQTFGAYRAELPGLAGQRAIVVNSVFWSASYCEDYFKPARGGCCSCENPGPVPGRAQFQWLEKELRQAAQENQQVWLIMHVPPGLDSYAEEKAKGTCLTAEMWRPEFTARYLKLIEEYQAVLQVGFAGHTHMDDFRLTGRPQGPKLLHKIVPAVSPIFKNHSAYQVYQWNAQKARIENWQTYHLANATATDAGPPQWRQEYEARKAYAIDGVTARSVEEVIEEARSNPKSPKAQAFAKYYGVSAWTLPENELPIYFGTILSTLYSDFSDELKAAQPGVTLRTQSQGLMRRSPAGTKASLEPSSSP